MTDAEVAEASAEPRDVPAIDPADAARWKAEQKAERDAYRQAEAEKWADRIPVTDAELERAQERDAARAEAEAASPEAVGEPGAGRESIGPQSSAAWWMDYYARHPEFSGRDREAGRTAGEVSPERAADEADLAEVRAELERLGELVDRIPDPAAERRAEMDQAGIDEPVVHEPQAEPELESAWQPGDAQGYQSRPPRRTPSPRWRSASTLNSCAFADLGADRYQAPGCRRIEHVLRDKSTTIRLGDDRACRRPRTPGKRAGAFGDGQV